MARLTVLILLSLGWSISETSAQPGGSDPASGVLQGLPQDVVIKLDADTPSLSFNDAGAVVEATLREVGPDTAKPFDLPNLHVLIHMVKWKTEPDGATFAGEQWSVYRKERWSAQNFAGTRDLGSRNVSLLQIHIGLPKDIGDPFRYDVKVTEKTAANVANLAALIKVILPSKTGFATTATEAGDIRWSWTPIRIDGLPSDIAITPRVASSDGTLKAFGTSKLFDNEGLYRWDVGIAVPITGAKDLKLAEGSLTTTKVDKTTAYGTFVFYLRPADIKAVGPSSTPYAFVGVSLEKKALHRGLVGFGWGPALANFFAGASWQYLEDDVENVAGKRWNWGFAFGLNVPVRALTAAVTK